MEPVERQVVAIRIPRLRRVQDHGVAEGVGDLERAAGAVHDRHRRVVVVVPSAQGSVPPKGARVHGPLHARGKVVLKGLAPAPDGGVAAEEGAVIDTDGPVGGVAVEPLGARGVGGDVAAAPAAPLGVLGRVEAVGEQAEEGRGVALHDVGPVEVVRAQGADADVPLEPVVRDEGEVRAALVEVAELFPRDALLYDHGLDVSPVEVTYLTKAGEEGGL